MREIRCSSEIFRRADSCRTLLLEAFEQQRQPDQGLAYLYCQYEHEKDFTLVNILGGIAWQLIEQQDRHGPHLVAECRRKWKSRVRPNIEDCIALLDDLCSQFSSVCILLDAFDECPRKARGPLIRQLARYQSSLKMFITTRFREKECLSDLDVEMEYIPSTEDISKYARDRLLNPESNEFDIRDWIEEAMAVHTLLVTIETQVTKRAANQ